MASRILYLTTQFPHGPSSGAVLRTVHIARALQKVGQVSLVIVASDACPEGKRLADTRREFGDVWVLDPVHTPLRGWRDRLGHELNSCFLNTHQSQLVDSDAKLVFQLAEASDLVWVHGIRAANICGFDRLRRSIIDVDDLHSQFYLAKAVASPGAVRKVLDYRMVRIWKRREREFIRRFSAIVVCSEEDRRGFKTAQAFVVPNGFQAPNGSAPKRETAQPPRLGFIGLFEYPPNRAGIDWFIREAWPLVRRHCPEARLRLVGKGSEAFAATAIGIDGLGYVDDPAAEIASWSMMIVPIRYGGGTRVKIAEAFARRCPVVSTGVGAFGYALRNEDELLLADSPDQFARACLRLLDNRELAEALVERAWRKFITELTWEAVAAPVAAACRAVRDDHRPWLAVAQASCA